jgi:SAM-dependent methyltransferase
MSLKDTGVWIGVRAWLRRRKALYALVRFVKYGPYRGLTDDRVRRALLAQGRRENWRMLNLGSGGRSQPSMINLDITDETGPDVVGDGFQLPFADGAFDAIFCESVIEHVGDPERFLAAASRALKAGGVWYLEVPFLQPFHGGVDFQRWTRMGFQAALRRAGLEPVEAGIHMGPGFMMMWLMKEWLALLLCFGSSAAFKVLAWAFGFVLSPLLLLDPILMRIREADGVACGHYYIARRPNGPAR